MPDNVPRPDATPSEGSLAEALDHLRESMTACPDPDCRAVTISRRCATTLLNAIESLDRLLDEEQSLRTAAESELTDLLASLRHDSTQPLPGNQDESHTWSALGRWEMDAFVTTITLPTGAAAFRHLQFAVEPREDGTRTIRIWGSNDA